MSRPQFSLRALLVVILVVGASFAWVAQNANVIRQRKAMRSTFGSRRSCFDNVGAKPIRPERPLPWLRVLLDDSRLKVLFYMPDCDLDGSQLRRVRSLFPETEIYGWPAAEDKLPPGVERWPKDRYWMI